MTTCLKVQEWVSARLDGEAAPDEAATVEDHLKSCGVCLREANKLSALKALVAQGFESAPVPHPPPMFAARVAANIRPVRRWPFAWPALAAAAAASFALVWFLASGSVNQELLSIYELKPVEPTAVSVAYRSEPPSVEHYLEVHVREANSAPPVGPQGMVEYVGFRR
ncbi:MAG: zf-HC2 domain-containing protein [Nitrospinae bacterium]|nr:zf-HC2 domain-containing protein [Nitrospinota bacterium]